MREARVDAVAVVAHREQALALDALEGRGPEASLQQLETERLADGDELQRVALSAGQLAQARLDDLDEAVRHGGRGVLSPEPLLSHQGRPVLGGPHRPP